MTDCHEPSVDDKVQVLKEIPVVIISTSSDEETVDIPMEVEGECKTECAKDTQVNESEVDIQVDMQDVPEPPVSATAANVNFESYKTRMEINKLLVHIKQLKLKYCSPTSLKGLKKKFDKMYKKIKDLPAPIHVKIQEKIKETSLLITKTRSVWCLIGKLLPQLTPEAAPLLLKESKETRAEFKRQQIKIYTTKYINKLKELEFKIRTIGTEAVDLNDEVNSAFIIQEKLKKRYMKHYYKLCDLTGHSKSVNRPVEAPFNLVEISAGTGSPELDKALEEFLNSLDHLSIPDYEDLFEILNKNNGENQLVLGCNNKITTKVFESVVKEVKRRRKLDFSYQILCSASLRIEGGIDILVDPAETDPELRAKLDANRVMQTSENEVMEEFEKRAKEEKDDNEKGEHDSFPDDEDESGEDSDFSSILDSSDEN